MTARKTRVLIQETTDNLLQDYKDSIIRLSKGIEDEQWDYSEKELEQELKRRLEYYWMYQGLNK